MSDEEDNVHELYPSDVEPPCESLPFQGLTLEDVVHVTESLNKPENRQTDFVNSPPHYIQGGVETADIIDHIVKDYPSEQAWLIANVVKYLSRAPYKGTKSLDMKKANWYLRRAVEKCRQE